jgi:hypothetical protein
MSRQACGGRGVTRRVTPSGEMLTRRSAARAATAAPTGTPSTTNRMSGTFSDRSVVKNRPPSVNGMAAIAGRSA